VKVLFVEIHVYDNLIPIVSGYLQAYATKDPEIRKAFDCHRHVALATVDADTLFNDVIAHDADVYAFSCYVWNMGTIKRVARRLAAEKPNASIVLGGHQAANHAHKYADGTTENIYVCNGEGEVTFYNFLKTLHAGGNDYRGVKGLSYYRKNELITTQYQEKMDDLNDIPSPFLTGLFEKHKYSAVIFETNRGCPFACSFCTWGGPGISVTKFDTERVMNEITWLAQSGVHFIYIADANWGMLNRDVDFSHHIADCSKKFLGPKMVFYAAAKNSPERSVACIQAFHEAGIITTQAVGVQSMSETTLAKINRSNIKIAKFKTMQDNLAKQHISSMSELMWPLPGETLYSLKQGVSDLIETGTDCIIIYSVLLINNAELTARRDEFELVTVPSTDIADESEVVVSTKEVSRTEYEDGFWFFYGVHAIYNNKGLLCLSKYLHENKIVSYHEMFDRFIAFYRNHKNSALYEFVKRTIDTQQQCEPPLTIGTCTHLLLHEERADFTKLLSEFVGSQDFWKDPAARAVFEIDLINRPYIYSNTPKEQVGLKWEFLGLDTRANDRSALVELSEVQLPLVKALIPGVAKTSPLDCHTFELNYQINQLPFVPGKPVSSYASYCHGMILRANSIMPTWNAMETKTGKILRIG
jgi:radical SAM superfamily enzyme YgiQ (UPF0313 family)